MAEHDAEKGDRVGRCNKPKVNGEPCMSRIDGNRKCLTHPKENPRARGRFARELAQTGHRAQQGAPPA
jgi:hypothetical protein